MLSKKRSLSDIEENSATTYAHFDDSAYRKKVLLLSGDLSENEYDVRLTNQAKEFGILPKDTKSTPESIDSLAVSLSITTISSEPHNLSSTHSRISESTMPTSCSSSERPTTQASYATANLPSRATTSSVLPSSFKKARFGVRGGFRRLMTKRKSDPGASVELMKRGSKVAAQLAGSPHGPEMNLSKTSLPVSFRSRDSSRAQAHGVVETSIVYDEEAMHRSRINLGLKALQLTQSEAAMRFAVFEARAHAIQKKMHATELQSLDDTHEELQREKMAENTTAEEQLEERQLKAEEDLRHELDEGKRRAMIRLRHMEAYCNDGVPPSSGPQRKPSIARLRPMPSSALLRADSTDGGPNRPLNRKVSKYDFDQLSQQYHILSTMDTLHESKINVLRGTQEQRTMALMTKNENALEKMIEDWREEQADLEAKQAAEEGRLKSIFVGKKCRMIMRWRLKEEIERKKLEKETGLLFGPLPVPTFPEMGLETVITEHQALNEGIDGMEDVHNIAF